MREWSRKNSKTVNARVLKYHHKNAEVKNLQRRLFYEKNKEAHAEAVKKWASTNKEVVAAYQKTSALKRRAQRRQNGIFKVSHKEIAKLQDQPCFYCGSLKSKTIDHVIPINKGGTHSIGNLVPCCKSCNSSKHDKFIMEWRIRRMKLENVH
jgi:5-methylcytosine-specific restriction endonuclease McrA